MAKKIFFTLKTETARPYEMLVSYCPTQCHNLEDHDMNSETWTNPPLCMFIMYTCTKKEYIKHEEDVLKPPNLYDTGNREESSELPLSCKEWIK
jgi:hypothetical protein